VNQRRQCECDLNPLRRTGGVTDLPEVILERVRCVAAVLIARFRRGVQVGRPTVVVGVSLVTVRGMRVSLVQRHVNQERGLLEQQAQASQHSEEHGSGLFLRPVHDTSLG